MSKMKHLLRKLHIGSALNQTHRLDETRTLNSNPDSNPSSTSSASSGLGIMGRIEAADADRSAADTTVAADGMDFSFLEEEFQVQLALAISASDPDSRGDPESDQIDAAKKMSLGCPNSATDTEALVELLSLRYWSYNVVNYDEKVMDGFYDVYGITSSPVPQIKMPLLVDLQAISVLDNVDHEVILVNRLVDPELQQLEKRVYSISMEYGVFEDGPNRSGLIQKIADMVVAKMGGSVIDADEMLKRWTARSYELRSSLNTVILPLGHLDVGLSRHRALLFKVLADRVNLPCALVKGSYYTGTDDGAVNLIEMGDGSEYIIDLMGAPGALIPAEVPTCHLSNSGSDNKSFGAVTGTHEVSSSIADKGIETVAVSPILEKVSKVCEPSAEAAVVGAKTKKHSQNLIERNRTEKFEHDFGQLLPSLCKSCEGSSGVSGKTSPAQKMKVKNVSKYVISAAKNPDFAQKLHAVLIESGALPPPDLLYLQDLGEQEEEHFDKGSVEKRKLLAAYVDNFDIPLPDDNTSDGLVLVGSRLNEPIRTYRRDLNMVPVGLSSFLPFAPDCFQGQLKSDITSDGTKYLQDMIGRVVDDVDCSKKTTLNLTERASDGVLMACNGISERVSSMLSEVAEWEIPWEDLHIGERIGIGSYGEVYHADWNGTEVAVKKFLDQDFSGDTLVLFKCEVEIMLRLRHPNVVLFMGAVTRPPHFSILTEFLPRGSLYRLLHRPNPPVDERRRMRMALDVAKGMNYLHTSHPTIVHRDLKSPNLLVDKNWVVKVCDFGLSRVQHHTFLSSRSTAGTPEWMAPEVLRNELANEKCDVYSFGVILWELATLLIPWRGLNPMQVVGAVGFQNRRLEIPEYVDPAVAQIIHECWQMDPHLRPSFSQLVSRLRGLQHLVIERAKPTH